MIPSELVCIKINPKKPFNQNPGHCITQPCVLVMQYWMSHLVSQDHFKSPQNTPNALLNQVTSKPITESFISYFVRSQPF